MSSLTNSLKPATSAPTSDVAMPHRLLLGQTIMPAGLGMPRHSARASREKGGAWRSCRALLGTERRHAERYGAVRSQRLLLQRKDRGARDRAEPRHGVTRRSRKERRRRRLLPVRERRELSEEQMSREPPLSVPLCRRSPPCWRRVQRCGCLLAC